jgi:hypothetical protein
MLCCLLAFLTAGPIGLAVTVPRGNAGFRRPDHARLWLAAALGLLAAGCGLMAVLFWYAAPAQSFFRHLCSVLPPGT